MSRKRWVVSAGDKQLASEISQICQVDILVALILVARGFTDPFEVDQLLDQEGQLDDPYELVDMEKAVNRIKKAITSGEKICVWGDYDADGITSTVMLYSYLKEKTNNVIYYVPEREEGYGLNNDGIKKLKDEKVELIVTVDNGITALEEIDYANSLGMQVVVTDHHLPSEKLPNAYAVVDPHRLDCTSSYKNYAGAGVAFKVICAMENKSGEQMALKYGDLAAVGTIADLMPLDGENRLIVKYGIELINSIREGFSAISEVSGFKKEITSTAVSFTIAPRLNAAGRVDSCQKAVELLLSKDKNEAISIAEQINQLNQLRQNIEKQVLSQAVEIIEKNNYMYDRVIVVEGNDWHHGIIGIVAARLCEMYSRPVIVLSDDKEFVSGSARSVGNFCLYDAIKSCEHLLYKFGGHAQAAGVTLVKENVEQFRQQINLFAKQRYGKMPFNEIVVDVKLKPNAFTPELVEAVGVLAPFGAGNPQPVYGLFNVKIEKITPVAQGKHLRIEVSKDGALTYVMAFSKRAEEFAFEVGDIVDMAISADLGEYMGKKQVSLTLKEIRYSGVDEEQFLDSIREYESFKRQEYEDVSSKITRKMVEDVYRVVRQGINIDSAKLCKKLDINYTQLMLCLDCLQEIEVIKNNSDQGVINTQRVEVQNKKELESSSTYIKAI